MTRPQGYRPKISAASIRRKEAEEERLRKEQQEDEFFEAAVDEISRIRNIKLMPRRDYDEA